MIIQVFPIIMLTMEPRMVNTFEACRPISLKHMMPFWCPFLDPHLTTYHSNIGFQVIAMLDKHLSTLLSILLSGVSDLQQLYWECGHVFLPSIWQHLFIWIEMETKRILLEAYKERQQKAAAAGAIPSFYKKACPPFEFFGPLLVWYELGFWASNACYLGRSGTSSRT